MAIIVLARVGIHSADISRRGVYIATAARFSRTKIVTVGRGGESEREAASSTSSKRRVRDDVTDYRLRFATRVRAR